MGTRHRYEALYERASLRQSIAVTCRGLFLGGAIVGGTVGYSIVQKGVKGYQAMVGDKPAAAFASSASDSSMPFDA